MTAEAATGNTVAERRAQLQSAFGKMLERYLPESGELQPWKLAQIESALSEDCHELARQFVESRLAVDPLRDPKPSLRCPECAHAMPGDWARKTHKKTIFGTIYYTRAYGFCRSCGAAFSPSGESVGLRQGLL
jgi:hypothetical protein